MRQIMIGVLAASSLIAVNSSMGQLLVECIPLEGTTVNGGGEVTVECFLTTDVKQTFVAAQLDFACSLPAKPNSAGTVSDAGITVDPLHKPEPWFLMTSGGTVGINNQHCAVSLSPTLTPGQVTIPGGMTVYLATIHFVVSDCASGNFNIALENFSEPPYFADGTRFMECAAFFGCALPFNFAPTTLTVATGTCCQSESCAADKINELCCSQTYPGASFFAGRSCEDVLPCGLCASDAQCDDSDFCNGLETCDSISGDCIPVTPPVCDDGDFCNGLEVCDPEAGCFPGAPPCAEGFECDEERDECFFPGIPTVSAWGLGVFALLVAIGAKVRFSRALRD